MPTKHGDLETLKRLVKELERVIKLEPLPRGIEARAAELPQAIYALVDDLIERTPASVLGSLGGQKTAERGPEYYSRISGQRKRRAGGRPKKEV